MSRPRFLSHFSKNDTVALCLILLGLAGMFHHFSGTPEAPAPPASRATPTTYVAALPNRPPTTSPDAARHSDEALAMLRRLREFVIPIPNIKSLPASDALGLLQHYWETLPHETDAIPPATFTLDKPAAAAPSGPVSLEIPGISLHTQLQLLAAQTGHRLRITETGALLESPAKPPDAPNQTTILPLDRRTVDQFTRRSSLIFSGINDPINSSRLFQAEWDPPSEIEVKATVADDGTIDLELNPDVVEFEGFINYGTPIQTTGTNALGESETIILTDSKIQQPVFTTQRGDLQKRSLARLFASLGIPELPQPADPSVQSEPDGYFWNPDDSTLTVIGTERTQRVAAETLTAIQEAATSGAILTFATAAWEGSTPPPAPSADAKKIQGKSPYTYFQTKCGVTMSGPVPSLNSAPGILLPGPAAFAKAIVEKCGARFHINITLEVIRQDILFSQNAKPTFEQIPFDRELIMPNQWHRLDLPAHRNTPQTQRHSLFVKANPASAPR